MFLASFLYLYGSADSGQDLETTKRAFTKTDTPAILTLNGNAQITLAKRAVYHELGASVSDDIDSNLSVTISGEVDTSTVGTYTIAYSVTDSGRSTTTIHRTVHVLEAADIVHPGIALSPETNTSLNRPIIYTAITLEVNATHTDTLWAINETLVQAQNRKIPVKGYKSEDYYYLYNIPLIKGENAIKISSRSATGVESSKVVTITSEANTTVPIAMRASKYADVGSLDTEIEVGTALDAVAYMLDSDGDGAIDEIRSDGNFSVGYYEEGRYRPRVTIRTTDNLLFSSDYYAMSLDVKADADQKDPAGAEPMDVAKAFRSAVLVEDREAVERLTGNNANILHLLYGNEHALPLLKKIYNSMQNWEEMKWGLDGRASINYTFEVNGTVYGGGMELKLIDAQVKTGREWIVEFIY